MTIIEINKRLWPFPESWNELTPRQALQVMKVICGGYTTGQMYLQFIRILSGCGWFNFLRERMDKKAEYFYLCEFLISESSLTKNLLPVYRGLHGPADNFDNLRMNEYAFAQNYFEAVRDAQELGALDKLVATLYRPEGGEVDMDVRRPFKEGEMLQRAAWVKQWPQYVKELVFVWYEGCLAQLVKDNSDLFNGASGQPALHGIVSVMRNVAKEGTYGDFEKVERLHIKMLMIELRESKAEAERDAKV